MPLNRYDGDTETICKSCRFVGSKPEYIPPEIEPHFYQAITLAEAKELGARFTWPDGLTTAEWTALRSLSRAREMAEKEDRKRQKRNRPQN